MQCSITGQSRPPARIRTNRQHASKSSHNATQPSQTRQPKPYKPPSCERILTQPHQTQPNQTTKATQTVSVRANPHTTPPNPAKSDGRSHPDRHSVSQSSHNHTPASQTSHQTPSKPPSCERILTQRHQRAPLCEQRAVVRRCDNTETTTGLGRAAFSCDSATQAGHRSVRRHPALRSAQSTTCSAAHGQGVCYLTQLSLNPSSFAAAIGTGSSHQ